MKGLLSSKLVPLIFAIAFVQAMVIPLEHVDNPPMPSDSSSFPDVHWDLEIADPTNGTGHDQTLVLDRYGNPHIAHFDFLNDTLRYTTKKDGTWRTETVDDSDLVGEFPSIAIDSKDRIHISYSPRVPVLYIPVPGIPPPPDPIIKALRYAVKNGSNWKKEYVDFGVWAAITSLALDSLDRPHISYSDWDSGGLYYAKWNGTGWQTALVDSEGWLENAIAVDSKGNPHIAYARLGPSSLNLYYASWDGATWQFENLGRGGFITTALSLAMDEFDRPHLVWKSREGLKYVTRDQAWKIETLTSDYVPKVAIALHENSPRVIYQYHGLIYGVLQNSTWSWERVNTTEKSGLYSFFTSHPLAIDSKGVPHLAARAFIDNKSCLAYLSRAPAELVADAGPDQTVNEGDVVQFNGSGSEGSHQAMNNISSVRVNDDDTQRYQHSPSIAVDINGTIYVVWEDNRNITPFGRSADIYFSKSIDGGKTFEPNIKINDDNTFTDQLDPDIAVDESGTLYVVWEDYRNDPDMDGWSDNADIYFSCSMDGGNTWSTNVRVNDDSTENDQWNPQVAVDSVSNVYVVWDDWRSSGIPPFYGRDIYFAKSTNGGVSFGINVRVSDDVPPNANHQNTPTITVDDRGNIYVAWHDQRNGYYDSDIYFSGSTDEGQTFESNSRVNDETISAIQKMPDIATSNGTVYLTWQDERNENYTIADIYFTKSSDNGSTFDANVRVNDDIGDARQLIPSIAVSSDDVVAIVWMDYRYENPDIYLSTSNDGGSTFNPNVVISDEMKSNWQSAPSVTIGKDGKIHVVYAGNVTGHYYEDYDIFYATNEGTEPQEAALSYQWDFNNWVDSDGDGNFTNDVDATDPTSTHVYGDNGLYTVTLRITDESGATDTDTCNITVLNVAPTITDISFYTYTYTDVTLRLAGEKWHDATIYLYEDGVEIWYASVVRYPGSPDDQSVTIEDVYFNLTKIYSAKVVYTPDDDPINGQPNGANPAWIILTFEDDSEKRIHHTFNVKHPETWEWNVELNQYLLEEITIEATATDLGSDDLTFNWSFGSLTTYYNNAPINTPDPFPSPDGIFPFEAKDVVEYDSQGGNVITLTVLDDDGGSTSATITLS